MYGTADGRYNACDRMPELAILAGDFRDWQRLAGRFERAEVMRLTTTPRIECGAVQGNRIMGRINRHDSRIKGM